MPKNKKGSRRRKYARLSLDELIKIAGISPKQKIVIRRYMRGKGLLSD